MHLAAALLLIAPSVTEAGAAAVAEARAQIVRAETVTAANADEPRGETARVHRDDNGTAWVEFV